MGDEKKNAKSKIQFKNTLKGNKEEKEACYLYSHKVFFGKLYSHKVEKEIKVGYIFFFF